MQEAGKKLLEVTILLTYARGLIYKIQIIKTENNLTSIIASNNKFEMRQFTNSLLKALLFPFGIIIFSLSFLKIQDPEVFLTALSCGVVSILVALLYKLRPLSKSEFLNDNVIEKILKLLGPIEIKIHV